MNAPDSHTMSDAERERLRVVEALRAKGNVSDLIDMLTDPNWVIRRAVVDALAALGKPAVEPLCDVLRDQRDSETRLAAAVDALVASAAPVEGSVSRLAEHEEPAVAADAAQILGRRRCEAATGLLAALAKHPNDNVAVAAIEALGRIGGRASVEVLIEVLESGSFFRTFPAIDVLGRSGDPRVVEPLAKLLSNPQYLLEAARALGRSGERAGVKPLLELLRSRVDAVVRVAAVALWELRERFEEKSGGSAIVIDELISSHVTPSTLRRLSRAMTSANTSEAVALCRVLGATRRAEAAPLLAAKLDGPPPVATCAAEALKAIGSQAGERVLEVLREGSSARRRVLLPVVTSVWAAPDVVQCLDDPDPEVRALACDTLARLGNPSVVSQIFPLLEDGNLRVVHSATAAIQALGTREARQLAAEAATSPSAIVRRSALRILAYFGNGASLAPMLQGLDDEDARVREAALQGLPYLEDKIALEALFDRTRSAEARTRAVAMRSLGHVANTNERLFSLLIKGLRDSDAWVRYYACQSLGRLAYVPAVPNIAALLHDDAGQVRVSAVEALSHMDSADAHEALREAACSTDVDVRRAALVGLGIAHRIEDLPVLLDAARASDAPTRLMALSAMAGFPSAVVLGTLSSAASDSNEQIRSAAIGFLAARPEQEATEVLIELLDSERSRERAKGALLVRSDGRIAGLLQALAFASDELAPTLVSILARLDGPDAKIALLSAFKLNNAAARKAAATALAARQDPESLNALREAADNDPDQEVRQVSALLLSE